ncbi:PIN domain nuclease [Kribbella sp. NPDC006257]|uniref:PIN domain nuclease n=1 Tax=Kribbella sp. NPDC006257 TaxID=3156738 RepID=UPI0033A3F2F7
MAGVAGYLVDKSALARLKHPDVADVLLRLVKAGRMATTGIVSLEMLYSARNLADRDRIRAGLTAHEWLPTDDRDFNRALEVQRQLTAVGKHRAVPLPDLLIAAIAERHQVTVLHYDTDFDLIATITGQPTQWVVPRGSVA